MKLYTEEQLIKICNQVRLQGFWNDEELTPISLPSDEEIRSQASRYRWTSGLISFRDGSNWVIDMIKNQQQ